GHASVVGGRTRAWGHVGEMAVLVIQKAVYPLTGGRDQQVQKTVTINIREHCPPTEPIGTNNSRFFGNVLELHSSKVLVKAVAAVHPAEENIWPNVVVIVPHCNSRAVEQHSIRLTSVFIKRVGKMDPRLVRRQQLESGFPT